MNTKKIMSAVCAAVCIANFSMTTPAQAFGLKFGGVNTQKQEKQWLIEEFGTSTPTGTSKEAIEYTPIVRNIQKRICDANGIELTKEPFQNRNDYKTKIHPVKLVDNPTHCYALATGNGNIYMSTGFFKDKQVNFRTDSIFSRFDNLVTAMAVAHEMTHNIKGHQLRNIKNAEFLAEKGSIQLTDNLPEGGWGGFLVSIRRRITDYINLDYAIFREFGKATDNRFQIEADSQHVDYSSKNGKKHRLFFTTWAGNDYRDTDSYFCGQLAYCYAKKALSMDNIKIAKNTIEGDSTYPAPYLLVCESDKLPNGYRILAPLFEKSSTPIDDVVDKLIMAKQMVADGKMIDTSFKDVYNDVHLAKKDINLWAMWEACAVAADAEQ